MGEQYKNQHIVSQAYLNRFAVKKGDKYIIGTRLNSDNKHGIKLFSSSVRDVGYIKNYYDTKQRENQKFWEHKLDENFDTLCGTPLENIIANITLSSPNAQAISTASKTILSRIIMSQAIRVPAYLDDQIEKSDSLLRSYKTDIIKQNSNLPQDKIELIKQISFDADTRKNMILEGMFGKERFLRFCKVLEEKVWIAFYNDIRHQMPFVTSDNPVLFSDIKGAPTQITKLGLISDRMVILFPITPSILIGLYSPNIYFGRFKDYDGKRLNINDEKFIMKVNTEIISQSFIHSFLPEPLFTMVNEIT